jgi:hypothetical protein
MPIPEVEEGQTRGWRDKGDKTQEWFLLRCNEPREESSTWKSKHHRHSKGAFPVTHFGLRKRLEYAARVRDWIDRAESRSKNAKSTVLELDFKQHVQKWKRDCKHISSLTRMITHPSYLRIIGMGPAVLPFLFRELLQHPNHWLVALNSITGEDPAVAGCSFMEAVTAWLSWGERHGYLPE